MRFGIHTNTIAYRMPDGVDNLHTNNYILELTYKVLQQQHLHKKNY